MKRTTVEDQILGLACASIARIGTDSPACWTACDTYVLADIANLLKERDITRIMVTGGLGSDLEELKNVQIFSVGTNEWSRGPAMSNNRSGHEMVLVDDGRIFIIGGIVDRKITNSVLVLMDDRWTEMPPMREKRDGPGVGVVDDRIFVIGGQCVDEVLKTCEVFSVKEDRWLPQDTVARMPTARSDMGVAVIGHLIFSIGGWDYRGYFASTEVLNTKGNTWATLPPMSTPRLAMGVAVIDDRFIWTFGGFRHENLDMIEVLDIETGEWTTPPIKMTSPRRRTRAVADGHRIYIIGGYAPEGPTNLVEILDVDTMTWSNATPMIASCCFHAAIGF